VGDLQTFITERHTKAGQIPTEFDESGDSDH